MGFDRMIDNIMRDVQGGSKEPFIVYRDGLGGWHGEHIRNQYGDEFPWVEDVKERDPFALIYTGADFAKASFPRVYDRVLCDRLRAEFEYNREDGYYDGDSMDSFMEGMDVQEAEALIDFFDDNIGELSQEVTDYLAKIDKPFNALAEMCGINLSTSNPDWYYNEDLTSDAVDAIEEAANDRLKYTRKDIAPDDKRNIEGYEEKLCIRLGGTEYVLAEKPDADMPYLVCNISYHNPLGIEERSDGAVTDSYPEAMRELIKRVDAMAEKLENEQRPFNPPILLTATECLLEERHSDWNGKLLIVKPETLAPEYHSAQHQLYICVGGNGARPDSRGQKVYVKSLYDGEECHFRRHQFAGVADPAKLPQWAIEKMSVQETPSKKPSLLGKLDANKQRVEQDKAIRPPTPTKSNDREV